MFITGLAEKYLKNRCKLLKICTKELGDKLVPDTKKYKAEIINTKELWRPYVDP